MRLRGAAVLKSGKVLVGTAIALALVGATAFAAISDVLGVGLIPHSALVDGPARVIARQFTSFPGESGGWHYHPGYVFNVVTSGTVIVEDGCGGEETFSAGDAFEKIDGRVHRWKNLGSEPAVEYNMFIVPEGLPIAVDLPERRCGPPRNASECRQSGWRNFTHPRRFGSQGDCIQHVVRHR
jgi:quercetin dioxygenase-like cupin family protein